MPAIVSRRSPAGAPPELRRSPAGAPPEPRCPPTRHHRLSSRQRASRRWCLAAVVPSGCGQRGSGGRQSRASIPFSSMSRFMYFKESKQKFLSPNSFSTMAEITPTTSLVVGYHRRRRTVLCAITPTAEQLSK